MKKIIALALTAAVSLPCAAINAHAAGRMSEINNAVSSADEIQILYNDKVVKYDDVKPVNTDGRVMIPFRAALESMGAAVDYDAAQRKVTAKKGDITINFTLMDDTIYIDKNGQQSAITMDVPMLIEEDRTLVPIRFMSEALDMRVGWDGVSETVIIMDYDDYFEDLSSIAPNMRKLANLKQPEFNKESASFDIGLSMTDGQEELSFNLGGNADSAYADGTGQVKLTGIDAEIGGVSLKDADAEAVAKDGQLYIRTDIIKQLALGSENAELKLAAAAFNGSAWYKFDLNKLIEAFDIPDETKAIFEAASTMPSGGTADISELLKSAFSTEGDAELDDAVMLAVMFDTLEEIDKYISVTEKDNGGYTVSMNISSKDYIGIVTSVLGSALTEEEKNQLSDMVLYDVRVNTDCDGQKAVSDAVIDMSMNAEYKKMSLKLTMRSAQEKDDSLNPPQIPADAADITDLLLAAME